MAANDPLDDVTAIFDFADLEVNSTYEELIEVSEEEILEDPLIYVKVDEPSTNVADSSNSLVRSLVVFMFIYANSASEIIALYKKMLDAYFKTYQDRYGRREDMPMAAGLLLVHKFDLIGGLNWQVEKFGTIFLKEVAVEIDYSVPEV